jgi:hypothetical protein
MARTSTAKKGKKGEVASPQSETVASSPPPAAQPAKLSDVAESSSSAKQAVEEIPYSGLSTNKNKSNKAPTVSDIMVDPITQLAGEHWATKSMVRCKTLFQFYSTK